jgi:hypothetical protein
MYPRSLVLLLFISPFLAEAWSSHPLHSFGGMHSGWPGRYPDYGRDLYDDGFFGNARRAPCPAYKPLRTSQWRLNSAENMLTVDMALPNIIQKTLSSTLTDQNSAIHVRGLRESPARRSCLPEDAKITEDGNYEILETTVAVPNGGIAERAQIERIRGGVKLSVPFKAPCPQYEPVRVSDWKSQPGRKLTLDIELPKVEKRNLRTWLDADKSMIRVEGRRSLQFRDRECLPKDASVTQDGRYEILNVEVPVPSEGMTQKWSARHVQGGLRLSVPLNVQHQSSSQNTPHHSASQSQPSTKAAVEMDQPNHPTAQPFGGVEVEDVPYEWPEKETDAAEGYFDARGDFYEY